MSNSANKIIIQRMSLLHSLNAGVIIILFTLFFFLPTPQAAPIKIGCLGTSISAGDATNGNSYPPKLQILLGSSYSVSSHANSSVCLLEKGGRPCIRENWPGIGSLIYQQPDIVTIELGTNDSRPVNWALKADPILL